MAAPFLFSNFPSPCLMAILNITPDSFSDGGHFLDPAAAITHARNLAQQGAALLDLGAEASSFFRTGIHPTAPEEQVHRLEKVLPALIENPAIPLSIDTRSALVARAALSAGASIINDISAGTHDPALLPTVAEFQGSIILMHMGKSFPHTPTTDDPDILLTVHHALQERIAAALHAGIPRHKIAIDPGLGFGKTMRDNWTLALHAHTLSSLGHPLVLGASRKRFLETPPPPEFRAAFNTACQALENSHLPNLHPRDIASAATTRLAARHGVHIHRVHNVALAQASLRT